MNNGGITETDYSKITIVYKKTNSFIQHLTFNI